MRGLREIDIGRIAQNLAQSTAIMYEYSGAEVTSTLRADLFSTRAQFPYVDE